MSRVKDAVIAALWLLPSGAPKRSALARLGHHIDPSAVARPNVVWRVGTIELGPGARVDLLNTMKNLRLVSLGHGARIGRFNHITSHPVYRRHLPDGARLTLESHAILTSRHMLDCAGGITIGEMALVAGYGSLFLTHSLDITRDAQVAHPIAVGPRTFIGARCTLLGGAEVPERSMVAAGATVARSREARNPGFYGGVPARRISDTAGAWYERTSNQTRRVYVPATDETIEDAF